MRDLAKLALLLGVMLAPLAGCDARESAARVPAGKVTSVSLDADASCSCSRSGGPTASPTGPGSSSPTATCASMTIQEWRPDSYRRSLLDFDPDYYPDPDLFPLPESYRQYTIGSAQDNDTG